MKHAEPTREQWEQLYEVAVNLKQMKPWEYLGEDDIVVLCLPGRKEPVFCSALGAGGELSALIVYPTASSFAERLIIKQNPGLPAYWLAGTQDCLMCNFADRNDVTDEEYRVIKSLGLKFRGKNQWIFFEAHTPGYAPWIVDAKQADLLISALQNFYMAARSYLEGKLKVDFENGKILLRFYSKEKEQWFNCETEMPKLPLPARKRVTVTDELFTARLKAKKRAGWTVELDLFYLPTPVRGNKSELPRCPKICILADAESGAVFDQHIVGDDEREEDVILNLLANSILQCGRPGAVRIRGEIVEGLIGDLCKKCGVKIERNRELPVIDAFMEAFLGGAF